MSGDSRLADAIVILSTAKKILGKVSKRKVVTEWRRTLTDMIKLLEGDEVSVAIIFNVGDDGVRPTKFMLGRFVITTKIDVMSPQEFRRIILSHLHSIIAMIIDEVDDPEVADDLKGLLSRARDIAYSVI